MRWLTRALTAVTIVLLSTYGTLWLSRAPTEQERPAQPSRAFPEAERDAARAVVSEGDGGADADAAVPAGVHPLSEVLCPAEMVWVQGAFCPSPRPGDGGCPVEPRELGYCIDRFEYPNQSGVLPAVLASLPEAQEYCRAEQKRLCTDAEWTFACRGTNSSECNVAEHSRSLPAAQFADPAHVAEQLERVDRRRVSEPTACVGPFGAFDLIGNVREWVVSEHPASYDAALKGGHYNQVSIGCERSLQTRQPLLRYPHTGLRCCADALVDVPGRR